MKIKLFKKIFTRNKDLLLKIEHLEEELRKISKEQSKLIEIIKTIPIMIEKARVYGSNNIREL